MVAAVWAASTFVASRNHIIAQGTKGPKMHAGGQAGNELYAG